MKSDIDRTILYLSGKEYPDNITHRIQAVWRRGRLSPRLLRPDLWCRLEFVTIDAKDIWRLIGMWHLTPSDIWRQCEFSDICRRTFNAHLDFQTFVARAFNVRHLTPIESSDICRQTFNARLNFQTFVARTFNNCFELLGPSFFRISIARHLMPVSIFRHLLPDI